MFQQDFTPFVTFAFIAITALVSFAGLGNEKLQGALIFYPPAVREGQWYRYFTSGLIHGDLFHLVFNMYALFIFGGAVERSFDDMSPAFGRPLFAAMYILALWASEVPTYNRHKEDRYYRSLGASGAVAAVIFAGIMLFPMSRMGIMFLPAMPGFIFGPLYILLSYFMDKRGGTHVNHSAHLWGALFGLGFVIVAGFATGYPVLSYFIEQVRAGVGR